MTRRIALFSLVALLGLATAIPAISGPMEDAGAAVKKGDFARAIGILRPLAEAGDPDAQNDLGDLYARGDGVAKDPRAAFGWWRRAAAKGFTHAQFNVGIAYRRGFGVERNDKKALVWLTKAAGSGHIPSQFEVGIFRLRGIGGPRDRREGLIWLHKAAARGHPDALKIIKMTKAK